MGQFFQPSQAKTSLSMNSYLALSLACLLTVHALPAQNQNFEVGNSALRQLGFCCGTVTTKCAQGCAGKSCDIQCSGTCGILNSQCGPYTCGSVTNACVSSSVTTEAATTAAATTAAATTAAATPAAATTAAATTASCVASGTLCLSLTAGQVATCCAGSSCSSFVSGTGYNCS